MSKNANKSKGDRAEREAADLLNSLLPERFLPVRRALGAGRNNAAGGDVGDLVSGIPDHVFQVKSWSDERSAVIRGPRDAEQQATNAGKAYAATLIRFRGGAWRVVLTPEQFVEYIKQIYQ